MSWYKSWGVSSRQRVKLTIFFKHNEVEITSDILTINRLDIKSPHVNHQGPQTKPFFTGKPIHIWNKTYTSFKVSSIYFTLSDVWCDFYKNNRQRKITDGENGKWKETGLHCNMSGSSMYMTYSVLFFFYPKRDHWLSQPTLLSVRSIQTWMPPKSADSEHIQRRS